MTEPDYSNIAAHHHRCLAWLPPGLGYKDDENAGGWLLYQSTYENQQKHRKLKVQL